jgi:hypothetical protein
MSRPTMSDHRCVSFVLDSRNQGVIPAGRNFFKADWTKFNSDMNLADNWSTKWSGQKIEERLKTFYSRLNTALDNACPKRAAKEKTVQAWWCDTRIAIRNCVNRSMNVAALP